MKILLLQIFRRHLTPYTIIHLYSTAVCFRGAAHSLHWSVGETLRHRHESLMLRTAERNLCHVSLWRFSYTWIVSLLVVLHWLHKACKYFITSLVKNAWQLHQFPNESHELLSSLLLSTASIIDTLALLQPSKLCRCVTIVHTTTYHGGQWSYDICCGTVLHFIINYQWH